MLIVVIYDIADDRRRNRVSSELKNYGMRVQNSVFECYLNDKQLGKLKASIETMIDLTDDHIRYYCLCKKDFDRVKMDGLTTIHRDEDYFMT